MAIISLLLGVILPAVEKVKAKARSTACRGKIRQLAYNLVAYSDDHDVLPLGLYRTLRAKRLYGNMAYDPPGLWWFQYIGVEPGEYSRNTLLQCPSKQLSSFSLKYNFLWGNYGVNWSVCKSDQYVLPRELRKKNRRSSSPARMKDPSKVFLLGDSGYSVLGWHHAVAPTNPFGLQQDSLTKSYVPGLSANKGKNLHPVQQHDAIEGRHPNHTVNMGFADAHVENRPAEDLLVTQTPEGNYINRSPLWKPR